jgi:hypothetical protein
MSNDPQVTTCDLRVPSLRLEDRALDRHPDAAEGPPQITHHGHLWGEISAAFRFAIVPHAFSCLGGNDFDRLCILLGTEPASQVADVAIAHGILCSILAFGFGATEALFVPC